jgi:hypothetical protein
LKKETHLAERERNKYVLVDGKLYRKILPFDTERNSQHREAVIGSNPIRGPRVEKVEEQGTEYGEAGTDVASVRGPRTHESIVHNGSDRGQLRSSECTAIGD